MDDDAEAQLASFLARFEPAVADAARHIRAQLAARMPNAVQLIYDNCNALVMITARAAVIRFPEPGRRSRSCSERYMR